MVRWQAHSEAAGLCAHPRQGRLHADRVSAAGHAAARVSAGWAARRGVPVVPAQVSNVVKRPADSTCLAYSQHALLHRWCSVACKGEAGTILVQTHSPWSAPGPWHLLQVIAATPQQK